MKRHTARWSYSRLTFAAADRGLAGIRYGHSRFGAGAVPGDVGPYQPPTVIAGDTITAGLHSLPGGPD